MAKLRVAFIIDEVLKELAEIGLAKGTLRQYTRYFSKMQQFFSDRGVPVYSERVLDEYWLDVSQRTAQYSLRYLSALRKSMEMVKQYAAGGNVVWGHRERGSRYTPNSYFQDVINTSKRDLQLEGSTGVWYDNIIRRFCCQLEEHGILELSNLTLPVVSQIIATFGSSNPNSMGSVVSNINKFLCFLEKEGLSTVKIETSCYVPCRKRNLIPAFSVEELRRMLAVCDRSTHTGRRDYAILLLAISCGLRRSDIAGLNLCDIHWQQYEIHSVQRKTGRVVIVPLSGETGNAIAAYILESRPVHPPSRRIFLTARAPFRALELGAFNDLLQRICQKASVPKIKGRNFHSLRRSAGTLMANSGVPVTTIAQVLGHSNCNSTDRYIATNPQMVSCSLDFTGIPVTSEVYQ